MQTIKRTVPQPKTLASVQLPPMDELPKEAPKPIESPLALHHLSAHNGGTLAVILKRTYQFRADGSCKLADKQTPILKEGERYEPLYENVEPSWKVMPEMVAVKSGTDVVIRGNAMPPKPVSEMDVGFKMGDHIHRAKVFGKRVVETSPTGMIFTPPEPFEIMPLRYENAYGGGDLEYENWYMEEVLNNIDPNDLRRVNAVAQEIWGDFNMPLCYPRNRFGKGYVIAPKRRWIEGRELPNIERPDDLLTPQRLIVGALEKWIPQPLPIGFDYFDSYSFPMVAMLGMPPLAWNSIPLHQYDEVKRRLIPDDFCKGEILTTAPDQIHTKIHDLASRQASLGLWFNSFVGNESFHLIGFDPKFPRITINLPSEVPSFHLPIGSSFQNPYHTQLSTVHVDTDEKLLTLTWLGHFKMPLQPSPEALEDWQQNIRVTFQRN